MAAVVIGVRRRKENAEAAREKVKTKRNSDLFKARTIFDELDANGNGSIEYAELNSALRAGTSVELSAELKAGAVEFDRDALGEDLEERRSTKSSALARPSEHDRCAASRT